MPKLNECWEPTAAERQEIEARREAVRAASIARYIAGTTDGEGRPDRPSRAKAGKRLPGGRRTAESSDYRGVTFDEHAGKWRVRIGVEGRQVSLGMYDHEEDAARAYDRAARPLGKPLNFPDDDPAKGGDV